MTSAPFHFISFRFVSFRKHIIPCSLIMIIIITQRVSLYKKRDISLPHTSFGVNLSMKSETTRTEHRDIEVDTSFENRLSFAGIKNLLYITLKSCK